jgi:hypothetical protein
MVSQRVDSSCRACRRNASIKLRSFLGGFGKIHLKQHQLRRDLVHRRQHHDHLARCNLPAQFLAL